MLNKRGKNRQMAINMLASLVTFIVNLGIKFLLAPFIIKSLGAEAYGFIGLSMNIMSYTSLITIALNSMAGRFITIEYCSGNINKANKYFASVFYSNIFLAIGILLFSVGCLIWLEYIINIPKELINDVKLLFLFLAINNILSLIFGLWGVSTFIKNRLDLSNIRGILGSLLNVSIIFFAFFFFAPHIWYIGIAGLIMTLYSLITNWQFSKLLTPELILSKKNFEFAKVKELFLSGLWNVISKLSDMMEQGFDLLFANIFIGASAMGYFSITKNAPFLILALFQTISSVFAPILTSLFAQNKKEELEKELRKTIRILGLFSNIPLVLLYIWGADFYSLWLPSEDSSKLQILTILGTLGMVFAMPLEALWNIFTITNKLKYSTITMFVSSIATFLTVIISMIFIDSLEYRLLILAGSRSFWGTIRTLFFLPIYGAHCLSLKKTTFYKPMAKSTICFAISISLSYILKYIFVVSNWGELLIISVFSTIITSSISCVIVLSQSDKAFIAKKVLKRNAKAIT